MPTEDELRRRYGDASDVEIVEAHSIGPDAYNPVAWQVIEGEFRRRALQLPPAAATEEVAAPVTVEDPAPSPEELAAAADGARRIRWITIL